MHFQRYEVPLEKAFSFSFILISETVAKIPQQDSQECYLLLSAGVFIPT